MLELWSKARNILVDSGSIFKDHRSQAASTRHAFLQKKNIISMQGDLVTLIKMDDRPRFFCLSRNGADTYDSGGGKCIVKFENLNRLADQLARDGSRGSLRPAPSLSLPAQKRLMSY
jgi:hypothetical protein